MRAHSCGFRACRTSSSTRGTRDWLVSLRQQCDLVAVDDLDAIAFLDRGLRRLVDRLLAAVVECDRNHVVRLLFGVLLDLVAGVGAGPCADDGRRGVAAAGADLMPENPADDASGDQAHARALAFLFDVAHGLDGSAGLAGFRDLGGRGCRSVGLWLLRIRTGGKNERSEDQHGFHRGSEPALLRGTTIAKAAATSAVQRGSARSRA